MNNLSITTAWNEATEFLRREGHLLYPLAFLLLALPGAAMALLGPQQQPAPGEMPQPGLWMLMMPAALVLGLIGQVALSYLALRPGSSVGEALGRGARRFLPMLGAALLLALGALLLLFLISVVVAVAMPGAAQGLQAGGPPTQGELAAVGLIVLILAPVFVYFGTRLSLMAPVAAAQEGGPIALLGRSWRLTAGRFWKLLGFFILFGIVVLVAAMAVQFVLGSLIALAAGRPEPGSLSFALVTLLQAALNALFYMFLIATLSRIYAQLTGHNVAELFA